MQHIGYIVLLIILVIVIVITIVCCWSKKKHYGVSTLLARKPSKLNHPFSSVLVPWSVPSGFNRNAAFLQDMDGYLSFERKTTDTLEFYVQNTSKAKKGDLVLWVNDKRFLKFPVCDCGAKKAAGHYYKAPLCHAKQLCCDGSIKLQWSFERNNQVIVTDSAKNYILEHPDASAMILYNLSQSPYLIVRPSERNGYFGTLCGTFASSNPYVVLDASAPLACKYNHVIKWDADIDTGIQFYNSLLWNTPQLTIDFWMAPENPAGSSLRTILSKENATNSFLLQYQGTALLLTLGSHDGSQSFTFTYPNVLDPTLSIGGWFHIAVTLGGVSSGGLGVYVNGQLVGQNPNWTSTWDDNQADLFIGCDHECKRSYAGRLSMLRISCNRRFSGQEFKVPTSRKAYKFDENTLLLLPLDKIHSATNDMKYVLPEESSACEAGQCTTLSKRGFLSAWYTTEEFHSYFKLRVLPCSFEKDWSISSWVKVEDLLDSHIVLRIGNQSIITILPSGEVEWQWNSANNVNHVVRSAQTVKNLEWTHIGISIIDGSMRLYINGVCTADLQLTSPPGVPACDISIGETLRGVFRDWTLWKKGMCFVSALNDDCQLAGPRVWLLEQQQIC